MLCSICMQIAEECRGRYFRTGRHHSTLGQLRAAAKRRCGLCIILYEHLEIQSGHLEEVYLADPLTYEFRNEPVEDDDPYLTFKGAGRQPLTTVYILLANLVAPTSYARWLQKDAELLNLMLPNTPNDKLHPTAMDTGSPQVAQLATRWFRDCQRTHKSCGLAIKPSDGHLNHSRDWYPDRLLDLTKDVPRLLITREEKPSSTQYATLSYCWGPNPRHLILTSDNLPKMRQGIPMKSLPKTFRDAIQMVRKLEIRYLWIDSLCIIQSGEASREDWELQSMAMSTIYARSTINISADWASDATEGCFSDRDVDVFNSIFFTWEDEHHAFVDQGIFQRLSSTPIWRRGWVVQERLLSRCVLHFGRDQIFWECQEVPFACESFPGEMDIWTFVDTIPFNLALPVLGRSGGANWSDLVRLYSSRELSFPSNDKFAALGAVAEVYSDLYHDEYVAGLFASELPAALCWRVVDAGTTPNILRSSEFRAPSWSWASIDGVVDVKVDYSFDDEYGTGDTIHSAVRDVNIDLLRPQFKTGPVLAARITLEGSFFTKKFHEELFNLLSGRTDILNNNQTIKLDVIMDSTTPGAKSDSVVFFPIISNNVGYRGIILNHHITPSEETYSRVGYFSVHETKLFWERNDVLDMKRIITLI
ncbi:heterokaryon incompatibility protein [Pochonia chlamydosporia 170]|uniref:Heterokaryon incompatibility protein n=1 Tax=Pochonia chlamydosporia 170 TaxID=1380566 RepID=A0A179FXQ9_METCM|nr:heterokaryon incompatibility protein [Pochonia chlamydosporia 170]OAQ69833.1 heterokaryon incompatibility protein [Pochonia chlamydosporia 170]